jgi:hypothetical protein
MKRLETVIEEILKTFGTEGTFTLRAHELTLDGQGWSSNDRFTIAKDVSLSTATSAARGRWEAFKANYNSKARVCDIELLEIYEGQGLVECAYLPFLDIEFAPSAK